MADRTKRDRSRFESWLAKVPDSEIGSICDKYYELHELDQLEKYRKARTGMTPQEHRERCLDVLYQSVQRNYMHFLSRGNWDTKVPILYEFVKSKAKY